MTTKQEAELLSYNITVYFLSKLDESTNDKNPVFRALVQNMLENIQKNLFELFPNSEDPEKSEVIRTSVSERLDRIRANDYNFSSAADKVFFKFAVKQFKKNYMNVMGDPSGKKLFK